jgi:hypothetical protein
VTGPIAGGRRHEAVKWWRCCVNESVTRSLWTVNRRVLPFKRKVVRAHAGKRVSVRAKLQKARAWIQYSVHFISREVLFWATFRGILKILWANIRTSFLFLKGNTSSFRRILATFGLRSNRCRSSSRKSGRSVVKFQSGRSLSVAFFALLNSFDSNDRF